MTLSPLSAVSPVDGRYHNTTKQLSAYFSEAALIKYRVFVEIEYFIALCEIPLPQLQSFDKTLFDSLRRIYFDFTETDAQSIKDIEKITNHDVKAVEYFIKQKFDALNLDTYKEFIHFGLTSQDVNNTAIPLSLREAMETVVRPLFAETVAQLDALAEQWRDVPMLARTHGQPASPTRLGKELKVFVERLNQQLAALDAVPYAAKFGGATGNFNAHHVAYPAVDWAQFGNDFVGNLGLTRSRYTTRSRCRCPPKRRTHPWSSF